MHELITDFGRVCVGLPDELFAEAARLGLAACRVAAQGQFTWALTGGSTPKAWYHWCVDRRALPAEVLAATHWFASDERCVPLTSDESNFGSAQRQMLSLLGVPAAQQHPWPAMPDPREAVRLFAKEVERITGVGRCFGLCFLGLGDDAHTASLFPGSALLTGVDTAHFAAVEVPDRGSRLTITPAGLRACHQIVVMATGAAKAAAVERVFRGSEGVSAVPAKVLFDCASRVTWLLDADAAARL